MKTLVMGIDEISKMETFPEKTIVIRISSGNSYPQLKETVQDIYHLTVDDIQDRDLNDFGKENCRKKFLTNEKIENLISFLEKNKDAKTLICQCGEGVSRSVGLAIGLNKYYFKDKQTVRELNGLEGKRPNRHIRYQLNQYFK